MFIRNYIPLKQGLRQFLPFLLLSLDIRNYIPLKQGLRLKIGAIRLLLLCVRKYIPLEQGLRPLHLSLLKEFPQVIRKYIPLQQGLRR